MRRILLTILVLLKFYGFEADAQNIDINLLKSINPRVPHAWYWNTASDSYILVSGSATLGTLAYSLLKHDKNMQHKAYETIIALGINVVATDGLKSIFNRTRPAEQYPNDVFALTSSDKHSFPSGHTSVAFATATSFTLAYKKWWVVVPAYAWASSVAYSRMYLGKHYPSDVLAGALVGTGSSLLSHWISKKIFKQPKPAAMQ